MSSDSPAVILFDELGNPVGVTLDGYFYRLQVEAKLAPGSTVGIDSLNTGGLALDSTVSNINKIVVSANNSSTTPLGAGASFIGVADNMLSFQELDINIAGSPSNADGYFYFEFSPNGVNWDVSIPFALTSPNMAPLPLRVILPFFRVRYVNGSTPLTEFRLTTIFHRVNAIHLTKFLNQQVNDTELIENVRAFVGGVRPDGTYGNVPVTRDNYLKTSLNDLGPAGETRIFGADKEIFGSAIFSSRLSQINADFASPLANNDIGSFTSGSGSVNQSNGQVFISTGASTTAFASAFTNKTIKYSPAREIYAIFSASFTHPTNANSEQRAGIYDGYNGFFVGYNGTTFGITTRNNSVDIFIPLTSCNGDLLDGNVNSRFTRSLNTESINPQLYNIYRIKFGWLGASPITYQVQSPDGPWVTFHTIDYPNTSTVPSLTNPNLPVTFEVIKIGSDSTDIVITTSCWDGGTVEDPIGFGPEDIKSHRYATASLAGQINSTTIRTTAPGRIFKCTSIVVFAANTSVNNPGRLDIMDGGAGGTILLPITLSTSTNQFGSQLSMTLTFPTPLRFSTDTYANIFSGTLTYSITVVGYEVSA